MFQNLLGVWDGLDECEISQPEILSQSSPANVYSLVFVFHIIALSMERT